MGDFSVCPPEALKAAQEACGGPVELKEITDRRGSAVWKATGPVGVVAVKSGYGDGASVTAREAAVLECLGLPGYETVSGQYDGGSWLVTRWFEGPSTWKIFTPVREGSGGRAQALEGAVALCRTVSDLHESGWVHGDLQPSHGIHIADGVRLIDFAWSWRKGHEPSAEYQGGITHLVAPELAASLSTGIEPVAPSAVAEVYALAGSLWTCATGRWPLDYDAAGLDPKTITPVRRRAVIADRRIPLDAAKPWPELQDVLRPVLLGGGEDRPTAGQLAQALMKVKP
jgi:serine/threonine protein kinase